MQVGLSGQYRTPMVFSHGSAQTTEWYLSTKQDLAMPRQKSMDERDQ